VLTQNDGKLKTVVENSTHGRYLASGYLVYNQQGTLFAAPMDPDRLTLTGRQFRSWKEWLPLGWVERTSTCPLQVRWYRRGTAGTSFQLSWLNSNGKIEPLSIPPGNYLTPRLSPDGTRLAVAIIREGKQNLWVYDLSRETWTRRTSDRRWSNLRSLLPGPPTRAYIPDQQR
jgi:hypothetical protein